MDHRPSDLDPYPRFGRDLATLELWDQSLERSRQRRRLEAASRSHRQRRKGTSIAVGAAMLAAPVVPAFAGGLARREPKGASGQGGRRRAPPVDTSSLAAATGGRTQLLRFGDVGPAVTAIQRQVGVDRRRDLRPDHPRGGRALPARPRARHDGDRRRAHVGGAVQRTRALLRRPGLARGFRPAGGGGAAGLRAPGGRPQRVGGVRRRWTGRARSPRAKATAARLPGSSGSSAVRLGPSRGPARGVRSAVERARAGEARDAPAPKQTTPAPPAPTTSAGGCTSGRIVSPVNGATLTGRFGESRPGTCTPATTSPWRAARRSTRRSAARSCSPAPSRATA